MLGGKAVEVAPRAIDCVTSEAARLCLKLEVWECEVFEECDVVVALALVGMLLEAG